jgi:fructose-specific phosphotransferase system IIC component
MIEPLLVGVLMASVGQWSGDGVMWLGRLRRGLIAGVVALWVLRARR